MKATVSHNYASHNDASNNGVNSDVEQRSNHQNQVENELSSCLDTENNSALANEMLAIERQADAMIEPVPHDPLLSAHTSEQHSEPPQLASQDSAKYNQASDNNYNQDALSANTNDTLGTENTVVDGLLTEPQDSQNLSPVAAAIATRNMLRSRKKALEKSGKKSSDAIKRPSAEILEDYIEQTVPTEPEPDSGLDLSTVPEQPYSEEFIDPATIKLANQVDKWAHMIDSMSLAARLRQLAIHATIDENSTDDLLILQLDQSIKHLNSDAAHKQLERKISEYLQRKVTVELNIVERTVADPYQIQADINAKRYEYAKQVLAEDEIVIALQQQFQAELDQETIVAR